MNFQKNKKAEDLNGKWICGYTEENLDIKNINELEKLNPISASVPGNFELDLKANGIIKDEFFGMATYENQKWETYYKYYGRKFIADTSEKREIVFEGLDTVCDIYINGEFLAHTDNMLTEHIFDVSSFLKKGENEITVKFSPVYYEAQKKDYPLAVFSMNVNYESLYVRKSPASFGWDIMPRTVSCGIWKDVYLRKCPEEKINHVYVYAREIRDREADLYCFFSFKTSYTFGKDIYEAELSAQCGDSKINIRKKIHFGVGKLFFTVQNPKLWWPKGSGNPNIYEAEIKLIKNGEIIDKSSFHFGIRMAELERTDTTDYSGKGEFVFKINGKKIFCKGSNWVPMDAFHSRDRERIPKALDMVCDLNCNMLRVWGGNVYEDDLFYEICDRKGIMVWQDFIMACGVYPITDREWTEKFRKEARLAVRRLRQHPSLILWSGDNECDQFLSDLHPNADPERNKITREIIPDILYEEDFTRPYLPSSPYLRQNYLRTGNVSSEGHPWGPRDYFKGKFYSEQIYHFASEIGYHGMVSSDSLKRFISPENIWKPDSCECLLHSSCPDMTEEFAYRNSLMINQVRELFGEVPENLDDFVLASQISQAEAKKFFIEFYRSGKWRRTGLIWWNLIDGWPQISDAVVDYYYNKKLAYQYIRASQQDLCLMFREPKFWNLELVASNDTFRDLNVTYKVTDMKNGKTVCQGEIMAKGDCVTQIESVPYSVSHKTVYKIEWHGDREGYNHYLTGMPPYDFGEYVSLAGKIYDLKQ